MGRKLTPKELMLYKRCDEVLHNIWDPIGVADEPGARNEYESYLPQVFRLLLEGAERDRIVEYLLQIETENMGLPPNHEVAKNVAEVLLQWRERIPEEPSNEQRGR